MIWEKSKVVGRIAVVVLAATAMCSCIDKHIPAPEIPGTILEFEADGQINSVIDDIRRTVTVELGEGVDMQNVRVSKLTLVDGGSCASVGEGSVIDLTTPRKMTVSTLADYEWTVSATQSIEYEFEVEGKVDGQPVKQVGKSHFELHSRSVFAYVPVDTDMSAIGIVALKLWPDGVEATLDPDIEVGDVVGFRNSGAGDTSVSTVEVAYNYGGDGRRVEETWHLYITETETQLDVVDPFTRRVWLSAYGQDGLENGFEYRLAPEEGIEPETEWMQIPDEMMGESRSGVFTATLTGLEPETEYEVRAFSGESLSDIREFTTQGERALPGGGFEEWNQGPDPRREGTIATIDAWNPWPEGGVWEVGRWWDSGNRGVAIVDQNSGGNSLRTDPGEGSPANPSGRAARLETKWAVVKAAGGNIYFGEFGEMGGLDATCHIGHPWQHKPTKLKGWFKYFPQLVDEVSEKHRKLHPYGLTTEQWMGSPDSLHVCVALWSSPDGRNIPFTVNSATTPASAFVDFGRDQPGVIAYGAFVSPDEQAEWDEFEIEIEYLKYFKDGKLPENTQLYLLVTASKNCNYFIAGTGRKTGKGSEMYVDELELIYD